jgi:O-antigen ligase
VIVAAVFAAIADSHVGMIAVSALCGAATIYAIRYIVANPSWLILALVAEEIIPYLNFIPVDPNTRWFLRYPLLIPLTLPFAWLALRERLFWRGYYKLLIVFWVWALVTVSYSLNPEVSLGRLLPTLLLFSAILVIAESVTKADDFQLILGRLALGCGILQILDAIAYLFLPAVLGGSGDTLRATWIIDPMSGGLPRFGGVFTNPNAVGAVATVTVLTGVAHWHAVRGRLYRSLLLLSMGVSIFFSVIADSRSETAAAVIGCVAYYIWKDRWRAVLVVGALAVVAVLAMPLVNPAYMDRGLTTATGRTEAWAFELRMIAARPIRGYGYQVEGEIFRNRYWTNWQDFWAQGAQTALHNGYISIAIGVGLPALMLWLIAFLAPWCALLRQEADPWGLKPMFFLVAIPILFLSLDESVAEPRSILGIMVWVSWAVTVRYLLFSTASEKRVVVPASINLLDAARLRTGFVYPRR